MVLCCWDTLQLYIMPLNVLGVEGFCLFCDLKDLTFRGVKLHIPHLFPLFETC